MNTRRNNPVRDHQLYNTAPNHPTPHNTTSGHTAPRRNVPTTAASATQRIRLPNVPPNAAPSRHSAPLPNPQYAVPPYGVSQQTNALPRQRRRASRQNRWTPWLIGGGAALVMVAFLAVLVLLVGLAAISSRDRIPSGVRVAGLQVGGQSVRDATAAVQNMVNGERVTFTDGSRQFSLTLPEIGVGVDVENTLKAAQQSRSNTEVPLRYTVDLNQAQNGLFSLSEQANIAPVSGSTPQSGRAVDVPVMLDRLRVDVSGELADGVMEMDMFEVAPPPQEEVNRYDGQTTKHVVERGQELGLIAREYGVTIDDIIAMNDITDPNLLYVGQELTIPAAGIYAPSAADAPAAPNSSGKAIVVDLSDQRIYAYENGQLVRSHLVSTGLPATPTVQGDYNIYIKYAADDMSGPDYYLPQVPYTMYFYQGYAIHGTYWHNAFGRPMSHGCVNLSTPEAEWFFNWAQVGTLVRVIA